jgi:hypothetical protein
MALTPVPYSQTPDRILNQIQSYIVNPLNKLIANFNVQPVLSSSCNAFITSSTSYVPVTNLSASITASGRPIRVELIPDGSLNQLSYIYCSRSSTSSNATFQILRDNIAVSTHYISIETGGSIATLNTPPSAVDFVDDSAPNGQHTYSIQVKAGSGSSCGINYSILRLSQE